MKHEAHSGEPSADEYAVYTAICHTEVYKFATSRTIFARATSIHHKFTGFPDRWSAPFRGPARYLCARQPEILTSFVTQNQHAARLEKRFYLPENCSYVFDDEVEVPPVERRHIFRFARCGFTADGKLALSYLQTSYSGAYFLFQREQEQWRCLLGDISWVATIQWAPGR
jgi:hypothetical protein